ncbi:hypothetical protein FCL47_18680, partial [Desulfopila sp. IMCC35006]|uniref:LamG-like jellyroll fold domain-containing protein n=1 Tax=Desulfopila sp. IMCC35006 TaxID=2569542 RepID=UPI0011350ABA
APTVLISEDTNNDGTIAHSEIDGTVGVKITAPADAVIDDILRVTNPDGTVTDHAVTQDILDNGLILEYARPEDGENITVTATLVDKAGNISETASDSAIMGDTTPTQAPTVLISEDTNNDGTIAHSEIDGTVGVKITAPADAVIDDILRVTNPDGTVTDHAVTQDILDNGLILEYARPEDGENITVTATLVDKAGNISEPASDSAIMGDTTASNPIITASDAEGGEDTAIALHIGSTLTDIDGSETLSDMTISGVPTGAILSAGIDNSDGTWTLTQDQLEGLTVTPPHNSDEDFTLTASVTSTEINGDTATTTEQIEVTVNAVADAPTIVVNLSSHNVVNNGLVGHWVFDENDTGSKRTYNLVDNREGILIDDAQFNSDGHNLSSMSLDGKGDYVEVVGGYTTPLAGTATLSAWIKLPEGFIGVKGNNNIGWDSPSIIGSEQNGGTNDIQWGWISDDGHINMGVANSYGAKSTTVVNDGEWHHVVLTRDHVTGETSVYVDGNLESTVKTVTGIKDSTHISGFGATFGSNGLNEYLQGELDDIRIYDRVLTASEVSQISAYENNMSAYDLIGIEGDPVFFTLNAGLVDTDGSESITSLMISGIPEGATLTDGDHFFTATASTTEVNVTDWDTNNFSITAYADAGGENQVYTLTASATTTESSNNDTATTSTTFNIFVIDTNLALSGDEGNDYIKGSDTDDALDGGEGHDTIAAGAGNDTIVFDSDDISINGGEGIDTLLIHDPVLDFSKISTIVQNIEKLDLSDNGHTVELSLKDVFDMTSGPNHTLEIDAGDDDTISINTSGWTQDASHSGLFTNAGGETVQIVSSDDAGNDIHIDYTDDGTSIG